MKVGIQITSLAPRIAAENEANAAASPGPGT
jgi:hypothetical protein